MKKLFALGLLAAPLLAGCNPTAQTNNPAVATEDSVAERQTQAPARGATSFTEDQARDHLVKNGYSAPTDLRQAEDGSWRGQATMSGKVVGVVVDYQGNITQATQSQQ